jgi:OOP family OmpA-OmpF porin
MFLFSCATQQVKAPPSPQVIDKMTLQVFFDFNKNILTEADLKELPKAVAFVKKYPGAKIRLDGYTDSIGTDAYNMKLSERRATAVKDYLIKEAGIDSSKITVVGHGEADPVADNKTAEGRAKNRRVEISILSD